MALDADNDADTVVYSSCNAEQKRRQILFIQWCKFHSEKKNFFVKTENSGELLN